MDVYKQRSPAHQNLSHPSSMVLIFSKYYMTSEMVTTLDFSIISDLETIGW